MEHRFTLDPRLEPADFRRFVELNTGLEHAHAEPGRRAALEAILNGTARLLTSPVRDLLAALPPLFGKSMSEFGWLWNGFYAVRDGDRSTLHVGHAFGPPVCSTLERSGGPLTSGMCFDGLLLNQTLAAYDTKRWPGYVSCDATSGLSTMSGIVVPVRGPEGCAIAVWDLDSTRPLHPAEVRTMDVLFSALGRCFEFSSGDFFPDV